MNTSLKTNAIYNIAYQLMTFITPLITTPYLSRTLEPEGIGRFAYSQSVANYFFLFAMLGVNNYGNRCVAQIRNNKEKLSTTFWQIYYMQLFQSVVMLILYVIFIVFFTSRDNRLLHSIFGLQIVSVAFDVNWFLFGLEEFKLTTVRNVFVKIFTIFSVFLFVKTTEDVWKYAVIVMVGTIFGLLVVWPRILAETDFERPDFNQIKKHFKPNAILFIPYLASSVYGNMDKVMLGNMYNSRFVGFYTYAENILSIPSSLVVAVCTTFMPHISNLFFNNGKNQAFILLDKVMHFTVILDIAMCMGIISVAPDFVTIYLGAEYQYTAELLRILAIELPITGCATILRMMYLIPKSKDKIYVMSVISGAIANFIGNLIAIPLYGAKGACIMTVFSNIVVLSIQIKGTIKEQPYKQWLLAWIPYVCIAIFMFCILQKVNLESTYLMVNLVVKVLLGCFIYCLLALIWSIVEKNGKEWLNL